MNDPRIIPVGQEPPPLNPSTPTPRNGKTGVKPKGKGGTRERFAVLNAFADYGARLVDTTAQACWWIVYRETKPDGLARVSHGHIAECVGLSRWAVLRAVRCLEKAGLLTVVRRGGLSGGASTYRVHGTPKTCSARATPLRSAGATGGVAPAPSSA
jgi:hypothetical protein